eukprot:CAMPEP_0201558754 /NCGR_PEP_ID=MMETSP0173_2-20130828/69801_1 /ASSEMBLY_ACC=CAM_ASM_000268 /TAXON_ID=218659 /ORGANISM="Vexillifera sp., Strain DIVA3 564/2" /LENGTH=281 /DNA_ID=CAMNT_0047972343 /DNA_START=494 /DNA_END=1336 /DNA_ORIENTATION=-
MRGFLNTTDAISPKELSCFFFRVILQKEKSSGYDTDVRVSDEEVIAFVRFGPMVYFFYSNPNSDILQEDSKSYYKISPSSKLFVPESKDRESVPKNITNMLQSRQDKSEKERARIRPTRGTVQGKKRTLAKRDEMILLPKGFFRRYDKDGRVLFEFTNLKKTPFDILTRKVTTPYGWTGQMFVRKSTSDRYLWVHIPKFWNRGTVSLFLECKSKFVLFTENKNRSDLEYGGITPQFRRQLNNFFETYEVLVQGLIDRCLTNSEVRYSPQEASCYALLIVMS